LKSHDNDGGDAGDGNFSFRRGDDDGDDFLGPPGDSIEDFS
jgi:hypothetical protein